VPEQHTFEVLTKYLISNPTEMFDEYKKKLHLFLWPQYGFERNLNFTLRWQLWTTILCRSYQLMYHRKSMSWCFIFGTILTTFSYLNFRFDKGVSTWINQLSHSLQQDYLLKIVDFDKILVYLVYLFCQRFLTSIVTSHLIGADGDMFSFSPMAINGI